MSNFVNPRDIARAHEAWLAERAAKESALRDEEEGALSRAQRLSEDLLRLIRGRPATDTLRMGEEERLWAEVVEAATRANESKAKTGKLNRWMRQLAGPAPAAGATLAEIEKWIRSATLI